MRKQVVKMALRDLQAYAREVAKDVAEMYWERTRLSMYPVSVGGVVAASLLLAALKERNAFGSIVLEDEAEDATIIVDAVVGGGGTKRSFEKRFPDKPFFALIDKKKLGLEDKWIALPWDRADEQSWRSMPVRLLEYVGENPEREGLRRTPERFLNAWKHWCSGYGVDPASILTTFEDGAEKYDDAVIVRDIPVYSHCEHHLAPFFGKAHVGYIPKGRVVGLSKIVRLVDVFARRLQVQERLTQQIANALNEALEPLGVAVVLECRHLCMESRGVSRPGALTTTSAMLGVFRTDARARAEFLDLIGRAT